MLSLSRVVPAADSCVTLAIKSYNVDVWVDGASRSAREGPVSWTRFVECGASRTVFEIQSPQRKVDNCRVFLLHKHVLCESFEM